MTFHATISIDRRAQVRVAPQGKHKERQVVLEYFPGDSPATSTGITFFCPDTVSAENLAEALNMCRLERA